LLQKNDGVTIPEVQNLRPANDFYAACGRFLKFNILIKKKGKNNKILKTDKIK
jgi:hypothetical protein